ncbi:MAG: hypothetical protein J1F04_08360 [Oscillospiraceae bacterium]|nr:hypothetical protein [Oscillospiraceae bacterium]
MGNRLTLHAGYRNAKGRAYNTKHNQRENFTKKGKEEQAKQNKYWDYVPKLLGYDKGGSFSENEKVFYKELFSAHVKRQNERNKKAGHSERNDTIASYKEKHPPEEVLLYIGTENVDPKILEAVFEDFRKYMQEEFVNEEAGCGIEMLNAALHMDEATPHIQYRQVYYYTDKYGDIQISQNKALAGLGFERPDPTIKESRMNNAKQTFTAVCREKLFEIAKSYGVELLTDPLPKNRVGLSIDDYRARAQAEEAWAKEREAMDKERENLLERERKAKVRLAKTDAEIKDNERVLLSQRQDIEDIQEYNAYRSQKAKERAEQEARKAREKAERETQAMIARQEAERKAQEEREAEQARETVRIAPETARSVQTIPDMPKVQTPLKNDRRPP